MIVGDGPEHATLESLPKGSLCLRRVYWRQAWCVRLDTVFRREAEFVRSARHSRTRAGGDRVTVFPVVVAKGDGTQDDLVREGSGWQINPKITTHWYPQ